MAERDSLNGKLIVILGGTGFVGTHLAQALLSQGARLRIASRHTDKAFRLRPLGNLGQIQFVPCDVTRPDSLAIAMTGADAAVNLVGAFDGNLDAVQAAGAGNAAAAAKAAGATAFVQVSAIGADAGSEVAYARTKAEGEEAVKAAFPKATIIRPSVLFGEDDDFINMFARVISSMPFVPVLGPQAKMQPLLVDDLADAIGNALADPAKHGGKTYEVAGPEVLTMLEINQRIAAASGYDKALVEFPDGLSSLFAALPGTPISKDQWKLLQAGNAASGALPGIEKLGVKPKPLGLFLDKWMLRYRKHGRFGVATA